MKLNVKHNLISKENKKLNHVHYSSIPVKNRSETPDGIPLF